MKNEKTIFYRLRKSQGLTQSELSRKINLSRSHIANLESGRKKAKTTELLLKYSTFFNTSLESLIDLKN